jgi:hypothetical protein
MHLPASIAKQVGLQDNQPVGRKVLPEGVLIRRVQPRISFIHQGDGLGVNRFSRKPLTKDLLRESQAAPVLEIVGHCLGFVA